MLIVPDFLASKAKDFNHIFFFSSKPHRGIYEEFSCLYSMKRYSIIVESPPDILG